MPWLWRPLWGSVWVDGDRAGRGNDGDSGGGKKGKDNAAREGEQQVKTRGSMPKWGVYVGRSAFYNPYQANKKPSANEQSDEDAVGEVIEDKGQPNEDAVGDAIEEKKQSVKDVVDNQIIESMSRQFEEVGPGVFEFKRSTTATGWMAQPGTVTRQPVRVDAAWYRSALPTAIADYHQVGQTQDGLPVYSFK